MQPITKRETPDKALIEIICHATDNHNMIFYINVKFLLLFFARKENNRNFAVSLPTLCTSQIGCAVGRDTI